jgi:hypothetical protein
MQSLLGGSPSPPVDTSNFDFTTIMSKLLGTLDVTFLLDMAEEFEEAIPGPAQALFVPAITAMRIKIMIQEKLDDMLEMVGGNKEDAKNGVLAGGSKFGGEGDDAAKRQTSLTKNLSSRGKLSLRQSRSQRSIQSLETMTAQVFEPGLPHLARRLDSDDDFDPSARSDSMTACPSHSMSHRISRHRQGPPKRLECFALLNPVNGIHMFFSLPFTSPRSTNVPPIPSTFRSPE